MPRPLALTLILLALAGCGAAPRVPPRTGAVATAAPAAATPEVLAVLPTGEPAALVAGAVGAPFEVPLGGQFAIGDSGLTVGFSAVAEDSRCPDGAQCLWQGRAVIALDVAAGDGPIERLTLGVPGGLTPDAPEARAVGPYTLRLIDLAPYPAAPGVEAGPYVATLVLEGP